MTLVKWNPFSELETLHEDMDRLFSRLDGGLVRGTRSWSLAMDVIETKDALKLKAAMPGIDPKDINIEVEDNVLTVSAERRSEDKVEKDDYVWVEQQYGSFSRAVTLPDYADIDRIQTRYRNGVLEITVPKRGEFQTPRRRKIEVSVSDSGRSALPEGTPETGASWWERVKRFFSRKTK